MAQLNSPGVAVTVVDESFYAPAAPSTVPLIMVASEQDKANPSLNGIAPGTLKTNAGKAYLITSQRDLATTFGVPQFKTDGNGNPIHGGEQNEYGLQAAYSLLGVSNRAYVVRADVDLKELNPKSDAPTAEPVNGTYWLDTVNSNWGVFEWNNAPRSEKLGQKFAVKTPIIITDMTKVTNDFFPKGSVGVIGDYALVSLSDLNLPVTDYPASDILYFKSPGNSAAAIEPGTWVIVGSTPWALSWPMFETTQVYSSDDELKLLIDGEIVPLTFASADQFAAYVNNNFAYVTVAVKPDQKLAFYSASPGALVNIGQQRNASETNVPDLLGIDLGRYTGPLLQISPHTSVPDFKSTNSNEAYSGARTGSIWVKTTEPAGGTKLFVKKYSEATKSFEKVPTFLYDNSFQANYYLDKVGSGQNIPVGAVYCKIYNYLGSTLIASFQLFRKISAGATSIVSKKIVNDWRSGSVANNEYGLYITEGVPGSADEATPVLIEFEVDNTVSDAETIASAINRAGLVYIQASVDAQNRITISHKTGGDFKIEELYDSSANSSILDKLGLLNELDDLGNGIYLATLWKPLRFNASKEVPFTLTKNNTLWYSSVIDEIDILVNAGSLWKGYRNIFPDTDPMGPIVSATVPLTQSDEVTPLANNDLWIDTSDLENFPRIYRFDLFKPNATVATKWVEIDGADQSSEDGILFADARYNTAGPNSDLPGAIEDLLLNDYVDPDAPDPTLYPRGMLLWNLRRSGFNVKKFIQNYIDVNADNERFGKQSMVSYYPHRWVTVSANQDDGKGSFGRKAQRKIVVQALQASINSSTDIREEARVFNLIACPGYPELIGEMVTLNYDRALTAFVIGDTPARLTPDATSLLAWGNNLRLAVEDNDLGAPSFDEYLAMFYPWGFTSDNVGNNVVVPPSHMMLRTIALSDSVSYPWFPPAGTRRGGITNATSVGYVDNGGEFRTVALNTGQRDTLYDAKINPITFFTGVGLVNYGQKTRAKGFSALDRINVARLVVYMRRQLDVIAKAYVFEPNDKITRDEIKNSVDGLMLELVGQRALYDYIVVCDDSNNTPSRIDKNELYVDIAIVPVKAVEFIYIPLRIKSTNTGT
jgi:hypothetical protein